MNLVPDISYQAEAVEQLVRGFKELIVAGQPDATMVFKAPTGSGKTVMMAMMLEQLREECLEDEFVFIWASMGDLAHQSYEKLSRDYLPDSEYNFMELSDMQAEALPANTVLFCNWEKMFQIKKTKEENDEGDEIEVERFANVYVRYGEDGRNLQNILELTREEGKKIVLIVDEAHRTYLGENSQKLVQNVIKPNLVVEVSATPLLKLGLDRQNDNSGRWVEVKFEDVVESGLIKSNTLINSDIVGVVNKNSTDEVVLASALKQRERLAEKYKEQGADINPLILVQLPTESADKMSDADKSTREAVEDFMEKNGITYDNGKLAIWVSGEHIPEDVKESAVANDSPIEVLIFKQAIATGWDCPRAAILVMLRDIKSVTFEIQTVGRILRMPELHHYTDSALNSAYVYTNINQIALHDDADTKVFFKPRFSTRADWFSDDFSWPSVYRNRPVGQRHRLNYKFRPLLFSELNKRFEIKKDDDKKVRMEKLDELLEVYPEELTIDVLADVELDNLDVVDQEYLDRSRHVQITADKPFIQRFFGLFLKSASSPYAPYDSSDVLKRALYKWFSDNGFDDEYEVQRIISCSKRNQEVLKSCIDVAKREFAKTMTKEMELAFTDFTMPETQEFGENYRPYPMSKHALQPYYRFTDEKVWKPEELFEVTLDKSPNVEWWYKNGVKEPKYFGVPYLKTNKNGIEDEFVFYPDYIVKFTDGTYGIFDTKRGDTLNPLKERGEAVDEKANGLQWFMRDYDSIAEQYCDPEYRFRITDGHGLWGGLINVTQDGSIMLQADAITQEMARARMKGEDVQLPEVGYDMNEWNRLII